MREAALDSREPRPDTIIAEAITSRARPAARPGAERTARSPRRSRGNRTYGAAAAHASAVVPGAGRELRRGTWAGTPGALTRASARGAASRAAARPAAAPQSMRRPPDDRRSAARRGPPGRPWPLRGRRPAAGARRSAPAAGDRPAPRRGAHGRGERRDPARAGLGVRRAVQRRRRGRCADCGAGRRPASRRRARYAARAAPRRAPAKRWAWPRPAPPLRAGHRNGRPRQAKATGGGAASRRRLRPRRRARVAARPGAGRDRRDERGGTAGAGGAGAGAAGGGAARRGGCRGRREHRQEPERVEVALVVVPSSGRRDGRTGPRAPACRSARRRRPGSLGHGCAARDGDRAEMRERHREAVGASRSSRLAARGTVPAKLTTPAAGASTAAPASAPMSTPRCWPAAYGSPASNENPRSTGPPTGRSTPPAEAHPQDDGRKKETIRRRAGMGSPALLSGL